MRLTYTLLITSAFALSCIETQPDAKTSVNIIKKFSHDLQSSPSGYSFHHRSDSVHPGGYNADISHGKSKIASQLGLERLAEMNSHDKVGTYRIAGGYGFVISHDYGTQRSRTDAPHVDVNFGASNADLASIPVLQLSSKDSGSPNTGVDEKSESVDQRDSEGLDSYTEKEIYGYMEYDKLVKDGKKEPSVNPGEYCESDVYDEQEKYHSDDGYGESNNGEDKGKYVEPEKYDGSEDYNENEHYGALRANHDDYVDDEAAEKYVARGEYDVIDDYNGKERSGLYEGYGESENNYERYRPLRPNDQLANRNENYDTPSMYAESGDYERKPEFEDIKNSFLNDFFKEYNQFSQGPDIQAGYKYDHGFDDQYYADHDVEDETSMYNEGGESGEDSFDDADSDGDHHEEENSEKNSNFREKGGHKKGSKTTGYRNMLHKDEYTKDHTFYENAKNDGHFDKEGDYGEHESQHEEGHEEGSNSDSHSNDDHYGKADSEDKGYYFDDDLSDHNEYGYKSYFDDNSDYINSGDARYGSEHGESYDDVSSSEPTY